MNVKYKGASRYVMIECYSVDYYLVTFGAIKAKLFSYVIIGVVHKYESIYNNKF